MWIAVIILVSLSVEALSYLTGGKVSADSSARLQIKSDEHE